MDSQRREHTLGARVWETGGGGRRGGRTPGRLAAVGREKDSEAPVVLVKKGRRLPWSVCGSLVGPGLSRPSGLGWPAGWEGRGQRRGRASRSPRPSLLTYLLGRRPDASPPPACVPSGLRFVGFHCVTVNSFLPRSVCPRILRCELLYLKIDKILFLSFRCHQRPTSFN